MENRPDNVLEGLKSYWGVRSESYSRQNIEELNNWKRDAWRNLILQHAPAKESVKILDVGTGPGFFAINLALAGHQVCAVDVTEEMLVHARENAEAYGAKAEFVLYDGEHLPFADESFDLVVSRNVLWNLEEPKQAYKEWFRVLKKGGSLMNCDGNFYYYVKDADYGDRHRWEHRHMEGVCANPIDQIGESLPMAKTFRPQWDMKTLEALGAAKVDGKVTNTQTLDNGHQLVLNFIIQAVK